MADNRARDGGDPDDEGYRPRRDEREPGGGLSTILVVGLLVGLLLATGFVLYLVSRSRDVALERAEAQRAAEANLRAVVEEQRRPAVAPPQAKLGPRLVGNWTRTPAGKDDTGYPYRFEFRGDLSCTTTRVNFDGAPVRQDSRVEVLAEQGDTLRLALHVPMGAYSYSFELKPDGRLILDDQKGGLAFTREK